VKQPVPDDQNLASAGRSLNRLDHPGRESNSAGRQIRKMSSPRLSATWVIPPKSAVTANHHRHIQDTPIARKLQLAFRSILNEPLVVVQ